MYYDEISEGYEELHKEEQLKKIEIIKRFLNPNKTDKLLDVGCGTGISTEPWDCERYGVDLSEKLIQAAKSKNTSPHQTSPHYSVCPAEHLLFDDDFFDIVISVTAIQNFDDIGKGLDEIKRVAKPDARFVLTFLKKSPKVEEIEKLVEKKFNVKEKIEEEKDIICFC